MDFCQECYDQIFKISKESACLWKTLCTRLKSSEFFVSPYLSEEAIRPLIILEKAGIIVSTDTKHVIEYHLLGYDPSSDTHCLKKHLPQKKTPI